LHKIPNTSYLGLVGKVVAVIMQVSGACRSCFVL